MVKSMSLWEKLERKRCIVTLSRAASVAALAVGCVFADVDVISLAQAETSAMPLHAAATYSSAAVQSSALQHAADMGPMTTNYARYYGRFVHYPYSYAPELWDVPEDLPPPAFYEPERPLTVAPPMPFRKPSQLSCIRPRVIVLGRRDNRHKLPHVVYGSPLPCGYRG